MIYITGDTHGFDYQRWYCGHFHTDKKVGKMQFLHET